MSKKTEAKTTSSGRTSTTTTTVIEKTNGHSTAIAKDMLTHKKRGDKLLRNDEREELMMAPRRGKDDGNESDSTSATLIDAEQESVPASLSGKDTWNFALLVVLCKYSRPRAKEVALYTDLFVGMILVEQHGSIDSFPIYFSLVGELIFDRSERERGTTEEQNRSHGWDGLGYFMMLPREFSSLGPLNHPSSPTTKPYCA